MNMMIHSSKRNFLPSTYKSAKKRANYLIDLGFFIVLIIALIYYAIKFIQAYAEDFQYRIENPYIKYFFDLFSLKVIGVAILGTLIIWICVYIIYKLVAPIFQFPVGNGMEFIRKKYFSKQENEIYELITKKTIKGIALSLYIAIIIVFLVLGILVFISLKQSSSELISIITTLFILLTMIIFSLENYFYFRVLYKNITTYKKKFIDKFSVFRFTYIIVFTIILIIFFHIVLPIGMKVGTQSFDLFINFATKELNQFESSLEYKFEKQEYEAIITRLRNHYLKKISESKEFFSFQEVGYSISGFIIFVILATFASSIIFPKIYLWGYWRTLIIFSNFILSYVLSLLIVKSLPIKKMFSNNSIALIFVYLIVFFSIKIVADSIEKYFSEKRTIECKKCGITSKKDDKYCRVCRNKLAEGHYSES